MGFFSKLLDTNDFLPRWSCGTWTPVHGWTHIFADTTIFLAYVAIPISLALVVRRRRDLPQPRVWILFALFIFSCGLTHLIEASIFWHPWYRLSALLKVITALVSVATAVVLARALPDIIATPGIHRLNSRLRAALATERTLSGQLATARKQLEDRTALMTGRARKIDAALAAAGVVACRWRIDTGEVDWEIGFGGVSRGVRAIVGREFTTWAAIIGQEAAEGLRDAARRAAEHNRTLDFQAHVLGSEFVLRMSGSPEPAVAGQPREMIGMFRLFPTAT
jgi:hypothetical protein